ncbi:MULTISPECIES: BON domain-containing protein [unclassified Lysobacter]|uniref:BON domain-containing protein n=1 Tax=unclassified Lysobacter TaxID=2635362 RepID=UPI001C215743|nr:BON domain-containing protein [Lysobacter sp. MMG2]MBU8977990.1 BON domain-containing protein [Lysobacter sp. MMG2]
MNERDVSRRNEERQRQRQKEAEYGTRSDYGQPGVRRWGAGEEWDEARHGRTQGHYAGDYDTAQAGRMGRQDENLGRDEQEWAQGRREAQRWGEQSSYGAQGREDERYGSSRSRGREYGGFGDRSRGEYAYGRDYAGSASQDYDGYGSLGRTRQSGQDYSNLQGYGTQAHGQGEHSQGTHGYGSGREFRGYEGGEAGRSTGTRHWERGYGEGYGLSSGYADEQAYDNRYGASGYATGYASRAQTRSDYPGSSQREGRRSYRGLGPKSYTRSDERLLEDIHERLTEDDYLDASDITVRCVGGVITLEGTVAERWMKHRAEDLADASSGVKQVDNRIQVQAARSTGESRSSESTASSGRSRQAGSSTASSTRPGDTPGTSSH